MKYSIIFFWKDFNYKNNCFVDRFFKGDKWEYTADYENADVVLIGSFLYRNAFYGMFIENFFLDCDQNKLNISINILQQAYDTFLQENVQDLVIKEHNIIRKLKGKKILCISEPWINYFEILINEKQFDVIFGCINNDNINNKYKYPLNYFSFFHEEKDKFKIFEESNVHVKTCEIPQKFCCLMCNYDHTNIRTPMYNLLNIISQVTCPSRLHKNCSSEELDRLGKFEYLKQFKFHICSENHLNIQGYITEKLFDCCVSGAIPIYAGNFDDIDARIYNVNRILFYDYSEESMNFVVKIVQQLISSEESFLEFYRRPVFIDSAANTVMDLEKNLINKVDTIV